MTYPHMRVWGVLLLVVAPALAGCVTFSDEATVPQPATGQSLALTDPDPAPALDDLKLDAPVLESGRAWTYTSSGRWATQDSFTVVVADDATYGYLFAAANPAQLAGEISWGRPWFGQMDPGLAETRGGQDGGARLFDFPLTDGKSWMHGGLTMTARAANLSTPLGEEPGFVITAAGSDVAGSWTYAPSVGYFTWYRYALGGEEVLNVSLNRMGSQTDWVWYESHARFHIAEDAGPQTGQFTVPEDAEAVVGYVGGDPGSTVALTPPPPGMPWTHQFEGDRYENVEVLLPAHPGTWTGATSTDGDGTAYIHVAAVSWVGPA